MNKNDWCYVSGRMTVYVSEEGVESARSLAQHTHIYTYIKLHTGCLCASGRGGGGHWCCINWEWVGNAALSHVWMHRVIHMNEVVTSWTSAYRNRHYPTRKFTWCHCHQQQKKDMWACKSVKFRADASRNCHAPTQNKMVLWVTAANRKKKAYGHIYE